MKNGHIPEADGTVVVGGGIAGLTAAAYLARAGLPVTLYERSGRLGGRAETHDQGGFLFNYGPHALYAKGPATRILNELGVSFTGRKPPTSGYFLREGRLHPLSMLSIPTTSLLSTRGKFAAMQAMASVFRAKPRSVANVSWREWSGSHVGSADARALLDALVRVSTYTNDPEPLSAEVAILQLQLAGRHGVLYLDGGWQTLIDGLRAVAERAGARIVSGSPVEAVELDDGRVQGVRLTDGSIVNASAVVIAGSPELAAELVEGEERFRSWAEAAIPVRAACLDLGFRRLPLPKQRFSLGVDRPYYFSEHSGVAKLAAEGTAVHVAKYLATDDQSNAKDLEGELEAFVDIVQPGWRDALVERRFLPSMVVVNAMATASADGLAGRPAPDATRINGLYVAGDWVGAEGWLSDASFASGKLAADLITQRAASADTTIGAARVPAYS